MHLANECKECILKRARGILAREGIQNSQIELEIASALEIEDASSWIKGGLAPAQLGTIRQQVLERYGLGNTYQKEKSIGKIIGKELYEKYRGMDELDKLLILATVANGIEFDVGGEYKDDLENFQSLVDHYFASGIEGIDKLVNYILEKPEGKLIYLLDNVGEHYCDLLLLQWFASHGWKVSILVKGLPILNDVTRDDLDDEFFQFSVVDTGNSDVGTFYSRLPAESRKELDTADLVIIKGMANFETLSRHYFKDAVFLLRAKCEPVARVLKVDKYDFVVRHVYNSTLLEILSS